MEFIGKKRENRKLSFFLIRYFYIVIVIVFVLEWILVLNYYWLFYDDFK